ncbi:MAG: hypothetical protein PVH45_00120 [Candidatus Omnitrophota bacterium]|jgi:hypothetical protein
MITKERLLAGLVELLEVEEYAVTIYASFIKALVRETEGMSEDKKKEIEKLLNRLYNDSSRHKEIVDKLIEQVGASERNEY